MKNTSPITGRSAHGRHRGAYPFRRPAPLPLLIVKLPSAHLASHPDKSHDSNQEVAL